jgi:hypothetical protein
VEPLSTDIGGACKGWGGVGELVGQLVHPKHLLVVLLGGVDTEERNAYVTPV